MIKVIIIHLFFTSCLCQFAMDFGMKPDVTFGEQNERFDVGSIIQDQNRMVSFAREEPDDYRKHFNRRDYERDEEKNDEIVKDLDNDGELLNDLRDAVDFAIRSTMESSPDDEDYEKNLAAFEGTRRHLQGLVDILHGGIKSGRRNIPPDPEKEILFHHGVPINMKIEGYLEVPS